MKQEIDFLASFGNRLAVQATDRPWIERSVKMKNFAQSTITALIVIVLMFGLYGCTKEGPAEKAGKEIDKTVEKAGDQIEKAGDKVRDTVQDAKK